MFHAGFAQYVSIVDPAFILPKVQYKNNFDLNRVIFTVAAILTYPSIFLQAFHETKTPILLFKVNKKSTFLRSVDQVLSFYYGNCCST